MLNFEEIIVFDKEGKVIFLKKKKLKKIRS